MWKTFKRQVFGKPKSDGQSSDGRRIRKDIAKATEKNKAIARKYKKQFGL